MASESQEFLASLRHNNELRPLYAKLRLPYQAALVLIAGAHIWAARYLDHESPFLLSAVPAGLGAACVSIAIAALLWAPIRWLRRKHPGHWLEACAIGGVLVTIASLASKVVVSDFQRGNNPAFAYYFSPANCEYKVRFPLKPSEKVMSAALGQYTQAELSVTDAFLRAECARVGYENPQQEARSMLEAQAVADGLSNATFSQITGSAGGLWAMRAHKTISGIPVTIEVWTYYRSESLLTLMVVGKSSSYPPSALQPFVESVSIAHP